jgi:hypothetical protein
MQTFIGNSRNKLNIFLYFRPFEGFNLIFWHNFNNLNSLEGIYAKQISYRNPAIFLRPTGKL